MESCCTVKPATQRSPVHCPECGGTGRLVDRNTVKAMLRPAALMRLSEVEHRYCPALDCPVVYFGYDEVFNRDEIVVPVFQKEPTGDRTVCYCFAVTEADLRRQIAQTGRSTAVDEITAHVKAGRCACEIKNPQGSCCLGNVATAVREATAEVLRNGQAAASNSVPSATSIAAAPSSSPSSASPCCATPHRGMAPCSTPSGS